MPKNLKVEIGSLVAFNNLEDAIWFEVLNINGFSIEVRQEGLVDGRHYASHHSDISLVKRVK